MASPILSQRTYRLTQIPHATTVEEVEKSFPLDVRDTIERLSLARCADPTAAGEQVSTITFKTEPSFLASLSYKFGSLLSALVENIHPKLSRVWIDAHFHGFTPLNNPTDETATVHIIALTGLGGKAFASWQCYDGSMWLRDHAPVDIPNCLISIYGYSSDVGNTDSISTLSEMAESFVLDLTNYAASGALGDKETPLILMGHCTGGLIIKDAWCLCGESQSPLRSDIYRSICGLVFFGTPHNGMPVGNVLPGLAGLPSENLVRDIEPGSAYIKSLKDRFSRATKELSIITCYELRQTPQSEFNPDGSIVRSGKSAMNVPESTACLYWANEVRLPINENHSMIAKLAKRHGSAYYTVVNSLSRLAVNSRLGIPNNHCCSSSNLQGFVRRPKSFPSSFQITPLSRTMKKDLSSHNRDAMLNLDKSPILLTPPPGFKLSQPPSTRQVRVYVHGIWDLFHYGHTRALEFAKRAAANTYLIVGVIGDADVRDIKPTTVMSAAERSEVVRGCKYVDEVLEDCPPVLVPEFVAKLDIDYFGCSESSLPLTTMDQQRFLELQGKIFVIPRTLQICSTDIVKRVMQNSLNEIRTIDN